MRRIQSSLALVSILALTVMALPRVAFAGASDIKLFTGGGRMPPNIMILLDNSGSMNDPPSGCLTCGSKLSIAKNALTTLITSVNPPLGGGVYEENARFGLFNYRANGGLLVRPIASGNTGSVLSVVSAQTAPGGVGTPLAGAILDVARYYSGTRAWGTLPTWGSLSSEPAVTDPFDYVCRDSFVIFISDGLPQSDSMVRTGFYATIGDADGDLGVGEGGPEDNPLTVSSTTLQWGDDVTYAMYRHDFSPLDGLQNVRTHVIGFDIDTPILERMAQNGGGNYYRTNDATTLASALASATKAAFDSLASYSTAVVPTSRTSFGSSFYNAFFEPRADKPLWEGHIEAYALTRNGEILDQAGNSAIDPVTDQLVEPHNPFWDAGIVLRTQTVRDIYTTVAGARAPFAAGAPVEALLGLVAADVGMYPNYPASGVTSLALLDDALVSYLHGRDAFNEDNDGSTAEMRPVVLGDIFHSTPRIISSPSTMFMNEPGYQSFYQSYLGRDRVIYSGANDGMLHAFDAGSLTVGDDPFTPEIESRYYTQGTGSEIFGYVPGLLLNKVKMVPRNNPRTYYFVDGSPVAADAWLPSGASDVSKDSDEWTTVLVTGFREGGPGYLALDVTDPAASGGAHGPYPKLLWEFTHAKLGQAWSDPVIARVKVRDSVSGDFCGPDDGDGDCRERWVAIFGGGYDPTTDPNHVDFQPSPAAATWTDRSKSIYIVALDTGAVLASVSYDATARPTMLYGLPSSPAVLDLDFDGFADVVYIGDLGGQMWKWDIHAVGVDGNSDGQVDNWPAGVFFRTPPTTVAAGVNHYRSFYYPAAASFVRGRLVLAFGSGEREKLDYPGVATADENNRMYVVWDNQPTGPSAFSAILGEADLTDVTNIHADNDLSDSGYYFTAEDGEKFVSDVIIFAGYVITTSFTNNSANPCLAVVGQSRLYAFALASGRGYWQGGTPTAMEARNQTVGVGLASTPRISIAPDPDDDQIYVKTSKGKVLTIDPPPRKQDSSSMIYWKQKY